MINAPKEGKRGEIEREQKIELIKESFLFDNFIHLFIRLFLIKTVQDLVNRYEVFLAKFRA